MIFGQARFSPVIYACSISFRRVSLWHDDEEHGIPILKAGEGRDAKQFPDGSTKLTAVEGHRAAFQASLYRSAIMTLTTLYADGDGQARDCRDGAAEPLIESGN